MIFVGSSTSTHRRPGITLTEILIAILIMGVGLVSLATLFPIGLLRLRDAARYSRTAYLSESAAADTAARALFSKQSFFYADLLNYAVNPTTPPYWWYNTNNTPAHWDPFTSDAASYGDYPSDANNLGVYSSSHGGPGLPVAYDPLWRYLTYSNLTGQPVRGYYLGDTFEARFGSGIGFIPLDTDGNFPSAHGLQRITNFNRPAVMPAASTVPSIFVSPEDVVWQEATNNNYTMAWNTSVGVGTPSPVVPDLSLSVDGSGNPNYVPVSDFRYTWMFTGYQTNATYGATGSTSNASTFDGNIVIFENRPFSIDAVANPPFQGLANGTYQVAGETVVEAVFGYSANVLIDTTDGFTAGYGTGADKSVLLRWPGTMADPVVKVGDWIADVTYERQQSVLTNGRFVGIPNMANKYEFDNLPAQRCFWYQVQKVVPPANATGSLVFTTDGTVPFRYMIVSVSTTLQSKTALTTNGQPVALNAALISPYVVNVIPQTFAVR